LFHKVYYNDETTDYNEQSVEELRGKFVKIIVIKKTDSFSFERFCDRVQSVDPLELKIQEDFSEFVGENVIDNGLEVEDTSTLLSAYVDNVETNLDKTRIKLEMNDLMTEAQTLEVV
jgi:hypothetical protein